MAKTQTLKKIRRVIRNWKHLDPGILKKLPSVSPSDLELRHYVQPALNGSLLRAEIIKTCHTAKPFEVCVETGAWLGATTDFLASLLGQPQVHSAELNPTFHEFSSMRLKHCPNAAVHFASSETLLNTLNEEIKHKRSFVYLDAHWNDYLPLRDELAICGHWPQATIMIDDFKVEGDDSFKYDDYGEAVGVLTLEYIQDLIGNHTLYFPAFSAAEDEGAKSGFIILTSDPQSIQTLDACPHVRRYTAAPCLPNQPVGKSAFHSS